MQYHCIKCGDTIAKPRAMLGYRTCLPCGEAAARKVRHTSAPLSKSNYIYIADPLLLKQLNPKRTT
jgi:predicted  nucleic acid-binding Zn-ribbon protein